MDPLASQVIEAAYAVGIGLAIGLEREHNDLTRDPVSGEPTDKPADTGRDVGLGVRTFALLALVGWGLAVLGDANALIQPIGMLAVVGLLVAQFVLAARANGQFGATTEIAAVAVLVEGGLVHTDRRLAVVLGLATALLLVSKPWVRRQVVRLRHVEISSTIQLAVLVAIVLPLLPTEPLDPWGAVPPRKVGLFVVLIAGVEYVGYVATRLLGPNRGAVITGLVGGLASSTAVTVSMARSSKDSNSVRPAQLATLFANVVMCARILVVTALLAPALTLYLAIPLGAMALVLIVVAVMTWIQDRREPTTVEPITLKNPFSLVPALSWGAALCVVLLVSRLATEYLGPKGFLLAAGASGLADVDAISLAASRGVTTQALSVEVGALAVVIAAASNACAKSVLAVMVGRLRFGRRIGIALVASAVVAVAIAAVGGSV